MPFDYNTKHRFMRYINSNSKSHLCKEMPPWQSGHSSRLRLLTVLGPIRCLVCRTDGNNFGKKPTFASSHFFRHAFDRVQPPKLHLNPQWHSLKTFKSIYFRVVSSLEIHVLYNLLLNISLFLNIKMQLQLVGVSSFMFVHEGGLE